MSTHLEKEERAILRELERQRWRVERTERGHYKAFPPDASRPMVTFGAGSGDPRSLKNAVAQLRRSGFEWPPREAPKNGNELPRAKICILCGGDAMPEHCIKCDGTGSPRLRSFTDEQQPEEPSTDDLYTQLKRARDDYRLHVELEREAEEKCEAAKRELKQAREDLTRAADNLHQAKTAFDAAFEMTNAKKERVQP